MINIGPTKEGHIPPIFEERLRQIGEWLGVNGEAIYSTRPWKFQNDTTNPDVWYTHDQNENFIYAILLKPPSQNSKIVISAPQVTDSTDITLLGYDREKVNWSISRSGGK